MFHVFFNGDALMNSFPINARREIVTRATSASPIRRAGTLVIGFILAAVFSGSAAQAAVFVSLLLDPATTAGVGSSSNRSGSGAWQVYAVDDSPGNFGISSFDVKLKVN